MKRILVSPAMVVTVVTVAIAQTASAPARIAYGPEPTIQSALAAQAGVRCRQ